MKKLIIEGYDKQVTQRMMRLLSPEQSFQLAANNL